MIAAACALVLLATVAADAGDGTTDEVCVEAELRRVTITPDKLPVALLASTQRLNSVTHDPDTDWARELLDTHQDIQTVAQLSKWAVWISYREEDNVPGGNASSPSYLRSLEVALNKTSPGFWAPPFWDCYLSKWVFGYTMPLQGDRFLRPQASHSSFWQGDDSKDNLFHSRMIDPAGSIRLLAAHLKAAGLFYSLDLVDLNQCDDVNSPIFGGSHNCDPQSTRCLPLHGFGTRRGGYRCACLPGFLPPPAANVTVHNQYGATFYRCVPSCGEGKQCAAQIDLFLRTFILAAQLFCIVITIVLAVVVFRKRKCKTIAAGMWTILETILLGILLLYASVIVHFFEPSIERCLFEPWFRELGFIVCYGAIILKLYRILMEFRTRKAHRWVVRDKDLLKYLLGMVVIMLAYLAAWTATNLNFRQEGFSLLTIGYTESGLHFQACKPLWWDYVTEAGEMMILLFGLHLGLAARNATVQFEERRFLCCTVAVEAVVSCVFYVIRALYWNSLHPDQAFLAAFARSQLTNTLVLMLIFTPKLWYQHKQVRDSRHHLSHEPSDAYKPQDGVLYPDMDVAEVSLAEMNPEDIRAELKRLYTQLEVLKNKTICQNNPHISKRRGGRKVAHRRFSLQKRGSREKALQRQQRQSSRPLPHETTEVTENEVSRTPEDSVCSMEGPSAIYGDGPSTYSELGGFGTPNITHRGNKQ